MNAKLVVSDRLRASGNVDAGKCRSSTHISIEETLTPGVYLVTIDNGLIQFESHGDVLHEVARMVTAVSEERARRAALESAK